MLNSIAIFVPDEKGGYSVVDKAGKSAELVADLHKDLEKNTQLILDRNNTVTMDENGEYHFYKKLADNTILGIGAKRSSPGMDLAYLFTNLELYRVSPEEVKFNLINMVLNTPNYIAKDYFTGSLQEKSTRTSIIKEEAIAWENAESFMMLKKNMIAVIDRGGKLNVVAEHTGALKLHSDEWENKLKKPCCKF